MALIETPPFGAPGALPISSKSSCVLGRLSDEKEWFVETPAVLLICSGVVSPMTEDQPAPSVEMASVAPEARADLVPRANNQEWPR